ncbi:MAG TPA: SDR family oxidoreductase [Prosthecobacter sp.]|jgi:nucleoside-diphosphate-sugar epimerase|nr:SDR family oxidoreductase [Prosthecobacter sp.]
MPATFTILGSRGYVGSHLAAYLQSLPDSIVRLDAGASLTGNLGHVFFCIGVTTDFASRLHDTMRAHVSKVIDILDTHEFESFTYLSSTRVYERGVGGDETSVLSSQPASLADFYKISKIAGEAACLTHPNPAVRVARLSNVIGFEQPALTFVPSLIRDALNHGRIVLRTSPDSAKDYILIEDVTAALVHIARSGRERVYNVSSGMQISHRQIAECIAATLRCEWEADAGGAVSIFPDTPATRLQTEFGLHAGSILDKLPALCSRYADLKQPTSN